ncbi:AMIN domain-containing protein [Desulfopila aestuarii]|nr:AMIN domain-containing protein [Desulfopila aestuarii]
MRRSCAMSVLIGLLFLVFAPAYGQKAAAMVGPLSHMALDGGDRVEISMNGGQEPNIFMIEGEKPRLVLDFPECGYAGSSSVPVANGILVEGMRVGFHTTPKQKVRVVIDLVKEPKVKWTKDILSEQNLLVISIFPMDLGTIGADKVTPKSAQIAVPDQAITGEPEKKIPTTPAPVSTPQLLTAGLSKVKMGPVSNMESAKESTPTTGEPEAVVPAVIEKEPADATPEPAAVEISAAPVLLSVSFDNAFSQSGEMVLLQLSDFQPPVISTREKDPPMIYCDFAGAEVGERVTNEISAGGKYVEKIRVAGDKSNVRVSLDLVPGSNYDLQQVYFKEDNLFVLIVNILEEKG